MESVTVRRLSEGKAFYVTMTVIALSLGFSFISFGWLIFTLFCL